MRKNDWIILFFVSILFLSFKEEPSDNTLSNERTSTSDYFMNQGLKCKETGKIDSALLYLKKAYSLFIRSGDHNSSITCLFTLGCIEEQKNQNIIALQYFAEANSILTKYKVSDPLWADILYKMGKQYFSQNNFDQAYHFFDQCIHKSEKVKAADSTMARVFRAKGLIEYYKGDYNAAIELLQKSADLGEKSFGKYSLFVSDQVNNIGVMAFMIGKYDEALSYYQKSESIIKLGHISSAAGLAGTYINIGLIFKIRNDFESALQFFTKGLELLLTDPQNAHSAITNVYLNIGSAYRSLNNHKKQFETLNTAMYYSKKYDPILMPKVYQGLAIYYTDIKNYNKAEQYYHLTVSSAQKLFTESPDIAYYYNNYGEFQAERRNYIKSLEAFQKAVPLYLKLFGERNPSTSAGFMNLSIHFSDINIPDKALYYIHKAIIANSRDFNNPDVFSNPELDQAISTQLMVELLELKAKILNILARKSNQTKEISNYQNTEWNTYRLTLGLIDKIRMSYINEESRLFLYENEQKTYLKALECALKLFRATKQPDYLEQAFVITDKTHASSLQSAIREREMPKNFKLTDTSLVQENKLKKELSFYQELILKEQSARKSDTTKIKFWTSKTTDLTFQLEHLLNQLKINKPAWYQYKYHTNDDQLIQQVRSNLNDNEVLIEYFYSDSMIYSFCLSTQSIKYQSTPLPLRFENNISKVLSFVGHPKIYITDSLDYLNYRFAASELYSLLIKPYEYEIKNKNLIIVPFEKLTYLPFETLLTHETSSKPYNFKELPYLIKQHSIRYLYASNLINIKSTGKSNRRMVAFAPVYRVSQHPPLLAFNHERGSLGSLQETTDEVKTISSYFRGKIFTSNSASEENFKKWVTHYSILHLAMHAVIEDEIPMYSRLVFTPNSSNAEDDLLYTYEIQNLQLDADLVVLSACNTGVGKLRKGEGMMSLTRGFAFAGIPSIVMTLWSVNDNSSFTLMKNFYHNLSSNCSKDVALHNAKLEYLKNSDVIHAHPYYWSGYVLIGDNTPLKKPVNLVFISLIIAGLFAFMLAIWLLRRKVFGRLYKDQD